MIEMNVPENLVNSDCLVSTYNVANRRFFNYVYMYSIPEVKTTFGEIVPDISGPKTTYSLIINK